MFLIVLMLFRIFKAFAIFIKHFLTFFFPFDFNHSHSFLNRNWREAQFASV